MVTTGLFPSLVKSPTDRGYRRGTLNVLRLGLALLISLAAHAVGAEPYGQCGSLDDTGYGPWDYTNPTHFRDKLPVVEKAHFTPEVESLKGHRKCGGDRCQLRGDLGYTLHSFPNHHRALIAMVRYYLDGLAESDGPLTYTPDCYFDRAMRFKPSDGTVVMIYGYYLSKRGKPEAALSQYEKAVEMMPNSAEAHYNVALLYTDNGDYERARKHAHLAYELGFPLQGLRRKLERKGQWVYPESSEPLAKE